MFQILFCAFLVLGSLNAFSETTDDPTRSSDSDLKSFERVKLDFQNQSIEVAQMKAKLDEIKAAMLKKEIERPSATRNLSYATQFPKWQAELAAMKPTLEQAQRDYDLSERKLGELKPATDYWQKVMDTRQKETAVVKKAEQVIQASNQAQVAGAVALSKLSQVESKIATIERKFDKAEIGAYIRDKFGKFMNSNTAGCGLYNRCRVPERKALPPEALDEVFPSTDPGLIRDEYYDTIRQKAAPKASSK